MMLLVRVQPFSFRPTTGRTMTQWVVKEPNPSLMIGVELEIHLSLQHECVVLRLPSQQQDTHSDADGQSAVLELVLVPRET